MYEFQLAFEINARFEIAEFYCIFLIIPAPLDSWTFSILYGQANKNN
jgi:hypothetical protein